VGVNKKITQSKFKEKEKMRSKNQDKN
jgi:hypothetical protein